VRLKADFAKLCLAFQFAMQPQVPTRIQLHSFIMKLVEDWNRNRAQNPEGVPSATEVTRTIWDAEETNRLAVVPDSANSLTLADLLKEQAIEYSGGHQWREMEDYINHLSRKHRDEMNLREFVGIFNDVLRDFGVPDDAGETQPDSPLGDFARAAKLIFHVRGQPFVNAAWTHIEGAGRPDYATVLEETEAKVRLLTLGCIYLDFCSIALGECESPDFEMWAEALDVEIYCLGQLVGTEHEECNEAEGKGDFCRRALNVLTDQFRPQLYAALVKGFGGVSALYSVLWQNCHDTTADGEEWRVTSSTGAAYEFVAGGVRRPHNYD
jgi:hypothetical protein